MISIIEKIKKMLFFSGLEKHAYDSLQKDFIRANQINLRGISGITALYMLIILATSSQSSITLANREHFIWCLCLCIGIVCIVTLGMIKTKTGTLIAVYLYLAVIFSYGIAIGSTQRTQTAVSFLIFIMVGPLLFYDRPIKMNAYIWAFNIAFMCISAKIKSPEAGETDIINGLSYGLISSILNTGSMQIKVNRIWLQKKLKLVAGTDGLTGLQNRSSFEHQRKNYAKRARKYVTCIYIDANGLHELNNLQGHEAGDRMLKYLAEQLILLFGQEDAYRIGGDEYLIFCCDADDALIRQKLKALSEKMRERQYSVSIGVVSAPAAGLKIEELMKKADAEMYAEKEKYYAEKGHNRRKQRGEEQRR